MKKNKSLFIKYVESIFNEHLDSIFDKIKMKCNVINSIAFVTIIFLFSLMMLFVSIEFFVNGFLGKRIRKIVYTE